MPNETRVQPCVECGWPALTGTRRCPFCRAALPRPRRSLSLDWQTLPLLWLAAGWFGMMAGCFVAALIVVGLPLAGLVAAPALGPVLFALLLRQRSSARIRALGARRSAAPGRAPRRPASRPPSSSDIT